MESKLESKFSAHKIETHARVEDGLLEKKIGMAATSDAMKDGEMNYGTHISVHQYKTLSTLTTKTKKKKKKKRVNRSFVVHCSFI